MATTTRLGITLLEIAQATKEVTVNEALWAIDALCGVGRITDRDLSQPDGSEVEGDLYYVSGTGAGAWAGHDGELAHYYGAAWTFYTLAAGMTFWIADESIMLVWDGSAWDTVSTAGGAPS